MKHFDTIKNFIQKYDRLLSLGALSFGFIVDSLTLSRIDLWFDNLILFSYLTLAGGSLILINVFEHPKVQKLFPFVMQYAYGGLFSGYVIFYSRSASLSGNLAFIFVIFALLIGNEFFRERYTKLVFQLSIFYIAVFSFSIFFIPVVLGKMGAWIFILSGVASLFVIGGIVHLLLFLMRKRGNKHKIDIYRNKIFTIVIGIYVLFNILYFTNIIPPIPLSLKEFGIYYDLTKTDSGNYIASSELIPWYRFDKKDEIKYTSGMTLYGYSAVFAPTKIEGEIFHKWKYFDKDKNEWVVRSVLSFPIIGGRDGGFRGFTFKKNLEPGKWRVEVTTNRGQVLGGRTFTIVPSITAPTLVENVL